MEYHVNLIANEFLKLAEAEDRALDTIKLHKLVYWAHGFSLGLLDRPLFYNEVSAWRFGPVIPVLYKSLVRYGIGYVKKRLPVPRSERKTVDEDAYETILMTWDTFNHLQGRKLAGYAVGDGSPWRQVWKPHVGPMRISNKVIRDYCRQLLIDEPAENVA